EELARRFFAAAEQGDTEGLVVLLAADAVAYGDGGGRALAFPHPVHGREQVARLLLGLRNRVLSLGLSWRTAEDNGQPVALFLDPQTFERSSSAGTGSRRLLEVRGLCYRCGGKVPKPRRLGDGRPARRTSDCVSFGASPDQSRSAARALVRHGRRGEREDVTVQ